MENIENIKDDELDKLLEQKAQEKLQQTQVLSTKVESKDLTQSNFATKMDDVKINVLAEASTEDKQFVDTVKKNLKQAAIKHTEVEQKKAELAGQQVKVEQTKVEKEQKHTEHEMAEDRWDNRRKWREYVYDGVRPIMEFVNIKTPFDIILMLVFTLILIVPYFVSKLLRATLGVIWFGACDTDRSKSMRGLFWTILVIIVLFVLFCIVYMFLKHQGIDILQSLRK